MQNCFLLTLAYPTDLPFNFHQLHLPPQPPFNIVDAFCIPSSLLKRHPRPSIIGPDRHPSPITGPPRVTGNYFRQNDRKPVPPLQLSIFSRQCRSMLLYKYFNIIVIRHFSIIFLFNFSIDAAPKILQRRGGGTAATVAMSTPLQSLHMDTPFATHDPQAPPYSPTLINLNHRYNMSASSLTEVRCFSSLRLLLLLLLQR